MSQNNFIFTSRYYTTKTAEIKTSNGNKVVYLRRRFLPQPDQFVPIQEHSVSEGERLDNITYQYLGDPEQFWRICDPNNAMRPEELTETVGRRLLITLPEGIPGPQSE